MPDTQTNLSDVIVPRRFLPYYIRRSVELSLLIQAGIVQADPMFDALASEAGTLIDMPFWEDLTGNSEVIVEGVPTVTGKIVAAQDAAIKLQRRKSWAAHDLVKFLAGDDPMKAIADLMAGWWARDNQTTLLSYLKGIFGTTGLQDNVYDIAHTSGGPGAATDANRFTKKTFIKAKGKLGDHATNLTAMIVHSLTEQSLRDQDLIDFVVGSDGVTQIAMYQGLRLLVDDGMPVEDLDGELAFTTYIFGQNAFALGLDKRNPVQEGMTPNSTYMLEFARDASQEISKVITRRHFLQHPRGVRWLGASMAAKSPTNAELENANNWNPVWDPKLIRVVKFKHNLRP